MGTVLFRDDFNGSVLDLTKWQPNWFGRDQHTVTKPVNGYETAAYDPAQVSISNGKLHLRFEHLPITASDGRLYPERTGCVTTLHSFATPADNYLVASRIHLEGTDSALYNWPAFWTDGLGTWPNDGENDILEGLGGRACWHYHSPSGAPGGSIQMGRGWHDFESVIINGVASYFYDGVKVGALTIVKKPHFIIIGNQSGQYGGQNVPCDMKVDFVVCSSI